MTQAAGKTGVGPTVTVAVEQNYPPGQRILDDPLAYRILPLNMRMLVSLMRSDFLRGLTIKKIERRAPGIWGGIMCRKRYIGEKLIEAAGDCEAVVNLGAGFDTSIYRLPILAGVPAWEVDQPQNIEAKRTRLTKLFGKIPEHVTLVPVDFDREELGAVLSAHGYSTDKRTFFIWEAVSQYLTEAGVAATFAFLSRARPGSRLAFTYVRKDFLDGRGMYGQEVLYKLVKQKIWLFGMDPDGVSDFIGRYGWQVVEHPTSAELAERYVRPTGRNLASTPIEQMVYAEKL